MQRIEIGSNVLDFLPECVSGFTEGAGENALILLVSDATRITRSGEDLKKRVEGILSERYEMFERVVIGASHAQLHADEEALAEAEAAVADADCVVVVGSGTITRKASESDAGFFTRCSGSASMNPARWSGS